MPEGGLVDAWAEIAERLASEPLPPQVAERTTQAVLDFTGVAVAGAGSQVARALAEVAPEVAAGETALQIGHARRSGAVSAATTNSAAGHALDLDDGHRHAAGHPGTVVIPAALAAAESSGCDGRRLLSAVALGYEVFIGLGSTINPEHLRRGFHTTATVGPLAAAMGAAVARGQDRAAIARSLSLAALMGAGLMEVTADGAAAKAVQVGRACGAGTLAAQLAEQAVAGPRLAIEGEAGFVQAMAGPGLEPPALAAATGDWAIEGCYVKRHASCRHTHAPIDAALALREQLGSGAGISALSVLSYEAAIRICGGPADPATVGDARFSIPFALALAIVRGDAGPAAFDQRALGDPAILELASRVSVAVEPRLDGLYPERRGAALEVTLADGRVLSAEVLVPKGEPENPLSAAELEAKFAAATAAGGLADERAGDLGRAVAALAGLDRGADLLEPLRGWVA